MSSCVSFDSIVKSFNFICDFSAKGLEICRRSDKNFNTCLVKASENGLKFFKDGFPALGIPATDPYFIDHIGAQHESGNSNFNLRSSLNNTELRGVVSYIKVSRVATKFSKSFGMKSQAVVDNIQLIGDYTMNGQILVLPIKGIGKANLTLTDVDILIDMRGDFFEKDGEKYINVNNFKLKLGPKHASFIFENVFNGDAALSETINSFMNEHWELVIKTLIPGYELALGERFGKIANKFFHAIPMKFIFPE